jgi:hypothetical protein
MSFGVFMHKDGSEYFDIPEVHYQFPKSYLSRAQRMVGDWIVYREPVKLPQSKGFFAVAKVERIVPDPDVSDRYRAMIEPGAICRFRRPFRTESMASLSSATWRTRRLRCGRSPILISRASSR